MPRRSERVRRPPQRYRPSDYKDEKELGDTDWASDVECESESASETESNMSFVADDDDTVSSSENSDNSEASMSDDDETSESADSYMLESDDDDDNNGGGTTSDSEDAVFEYQDE